MHTLGLWYLLGCTETPSKRISVPQFPTISIRVQEQSYTVEYACEAHEVALGLRYRQLKSNEGMLLCSDKGGILSMNKMKSAISVAFLSEEQRILSIETFLLSTPDYPIGDSVHWLWEMPSGWFEEQGIRAKMKVEGVPGEGK